MQLSRFVTATKTCPSDELRIGFIADLCFALHHVTNCCMLWRCNANAVLTKCNQAVNVQQSNWNIYLSSKDKEFAIKRSSGTATFPEVTADFV